MVDHDAVSSFGLRALITNREISWYVVLVDLAWLGPYQRLIVFILLPKGH